MKIHSVVIDIKGTDADEPGCTARYDSVSCKWQIEGGPMYPKYLKMLTDISDTCRELDRNKGQVMP